ncbi:MAG: SulP family inorganic anion transporter [Elainellaceae cyanobacterium]
MSLKFSLSSLSESSVYQTFQTEIQPKRLVSSLVAGGITGMIGVIRAISYAALIFSGSLASDLTVGVGIAVLSSALISIVVALTSSLPGMIATPLAAPTVVLTVLAASIADQLGLTANHQDLLLTVVAAIAIGSLITGFVLWLLGQLKWGNALNFLPYPVVGGFMAGTGLLLIRGAFKVMTGDDLTLQHLSWFAEPEQWPRWLAGLAIATVLLGATKLSHHYLVMPGILLLSTGVFYGTIWIYQMPLEVIRTHGWLLGPFPKGTLWHPLTPESLSHIQWGSIVQSSDSLALLVFVSLLSLVLTNGSIELAVEKDLDLNRELKAVGLANMVAGLGSTMAGNQALPSTLLVHRLGAANRLTGVFKTLPCFAVLILGPTFLNYFPKPILGSLLLFLGLDLLWQWLYKVWFKLPITDYGIILVTLVVINRAGFLSGIGVGFGLAAIQFLVQCSRLVPVAVVPSAEEEPQIKGEHLQEQAEAIHASHKLINAPDPSPSEFEANTALACVDLEGLLFFGTARVLCQQLCDRILHFHSNCAPLQYLLLDFQQVLVLDSSAAMALSKVSKLAEKHDCKLVFVALSESHKRQLLKSQVIDQESLVWPDRAMALQSCQAQVQKTPNSHAPAPLSEEPPQPIDHLSEAQKSDPTTLELTELSP